MEALPSPAEYRKSGRTAELYSSIRIRAAPGRIWEILTDFQKYPEWNPFIRTIGGDPAEGAEISADLRPQGGTGMTIHPVITKVVPGQELRWVGRLFVRGLFDGEHIFEILPSDADSCLFVQHEYFSGILIPLLENMLKNETARGFDGMNKALKARASTLKNRVPLHTIPTTGICICKNRQPRSFHYSY
jgi:hypothetical protein